MVNVVNTTQAKMLASAIELELSIAGTVASVAGVSNEEGLSLESPASGVGWAMGVGADVVAELSTMGPTEGEGVGSRANTSSKTVFN